jgi:hypothetical protein
MFTARVPALAGASVVAVAVGAVLLGSDGVTDGSRTLARLEAPRGTVVASSRSTTTSASPTTHVAALAVHAPQTEARDDDANEDDAADGHEHQHGENDRRAQLPSGAWERLALERRTFDDVLAALVRAQAAGDDDALASAREEVTLLVDADGPRAREHLLAALTSAPSEERALAVAELLASAVDATPEPRLVAALTDVAGRDGEAFRRVAAVRALGDLPYPDAERVELFARVVRDDRDATVREAGASALVAASSGTEVASLVARNAADALGTEKSPYVRTLLVHAIQDATDARAVETLIAVAKTDPEAAVRGAAVAVLAEVAPAKAATLSPANEPDEDVRAAIASLTTR